MNATKTTFKVEGTDELRINNFNREFVVRLTTILNDTYQAAITRLDFL
jgi:hypothetical protein